MCLESCVSQLLSVSPRVKSSRQSSPPAESTSIRRDVDTAVGQVGGDGHELIDETGPTHQSEGVDQLVMISNHTENVTC